VWTVNIIDGKKIAEGVLGALKEKAPPKKFFAAFCVSPDDATGKFLEQKKKTAASLGVDFRLYEFPSVITQDDLRKEVLVVVSGAACGGAIIQLPLPAHIDAQYVLNAIPREKDVDVLGERALGAFYAGRNPILPPAVGTVEEVIRNSKLEIQNSSAAIVGLGHLVGKPVAHWLEGKCKNLFLLDKGSDFSILKSADIVVCGAGDPGIVAPEMLKDKVLVIDFGYGIKNGKPSGDFDSNQLKAKSYKLTYTPTPNGTGPILIVKLFSNFYMLAGNEEVKKKRKFYSS